MRTICPRVKIAAGLVALLLLLSGCDQANLAMTPTMPATLPATIAALSPRSETATPSPIPSPPTLTPRPSFTPGPAAVAPTPTPGPQPLLLAGSGGQPTLADYWAGAATFVLQVADTGLPLGESDTIIMSNGEYWSYVHASQRSAGTIDQCGAPVPFPGCTVIYRSFDGGMHFENADPPVCQFACNQCPCDSETDHIEQQQYPRVFYDGYTMFVVYEYLGRLMLRHSPDGLDWSTPNRIADTGIWKKWLLPCPDAEFIGQHPFVPYDFECLAGGPPGIFVVADQVYVFLAVGQSPAGMGCYTGRVDDAGALFRRCDNNPLFSGAAEYGPLAEKGPSTNAFFDFRTISSAEVLQIDASAGRRYYMLYEGIRGPGPGDPGDTQFGLGLARSLTADIDGPWETFPGNPLLVDLPGNIGLGHADLVVADGQTILYTSLDGERRSRLVLVWQSDTAGD